MKQTLKIIAISALATAALIKGVPALAEAGSAQNVSIVQTGDLDLSTSAGRSALDHRLVIAAREVCGTASDVDLAGKNQVRGCRSDVLAQARARSAAVVASRASEGSILVAAR
jgi:UrcA family protein